MATSKNTKTLRISAALTKAALIKELQKGQRWLKAAERAAAKSDLNRRKETAADSNLDLSVRRDAVVLRLQEEVSAFEQAAAHASPSEGGAHKLVRVVLMPGPGNEEADLRLSIDLILNAESDVWDGKYHAVGFAGYLDAPDELYPFILRGDQISYGADDDADPLIKIRDKPVRVGEVFPFFPDGEARSDGRGGSYRVAKIVPLLNGHR